MWMADLVRTRTLAPDKKIPIKDRVRANRSYWNQDKLRARRGRRLSTLQIRALRELQTFRWGVSLSKETGPPPPIDHLPARLGLEGIMRLPSEPWLALQSCEVFGTCYVGYAIHRSWLGSPSLVVRGSEGIYSPSSGSQVSRPNTHKVTRPLRHSTDRFPV